MKPKHTKDEIPSKYQHMKVHSFNFLQHEIGNNALIGLDKNGGKIDNGFSQNGQATTEKTIIPKSQTDSTQNSIMETEDPSRTSKTKTTERAETSIVTDSRTDFSGSAPKRYTTKCYIKPIPVPIWYTESIFLTIGSTRRRYEEKVYIKNKLRPCKWSESMSTEVKIVPQYIISDISIPVEESTHYISFEPQQIAAAN